MVKPEGFPDFFVIGAPRCGTTAICRYLSRHPGICFSRPKEPHYFSQVDQLPTVEDLRRDYIDRYFDHRTPDHELVGEGSVSYLLMPESVRKALQFNPAAKFIAIVRNPLTLAPSYHQRMLFIGATRNGKALDSLQRRKRKYNKDGSKKRGLVKRIVDLNKVTRRPPPLSPRMATIIREHTCDDNELLSQLLERDLSFWLDAD